MRLFYTLLFFSCLHLISQNRGNVWELDQIQIDFNTTTNTVLTNTSNTVSSQSSICNTNGEVILNYDGLTLYDKNSQIIKSNERFGKAYNSVIFKKIGCNSKYYLFETKAFRTPNQGVPREINIVPKLYYSQYEIDELGNVTVIEEDVLYFETSIYSGLTAYVNDEVQKVWVVVRNGINLFTIEVNERGPESHQISKLGDPKILKYFVDGRDQMYNVFNDLKINAEGDKIITFIRTNNYLTLEKEFIEADGYIQILTFDKETGEAGDYFTQTTIEKGETATNLFHPLVGEIQGDKLYTAIRTRYLPFGLPPEHFLHEYDLSHPDIKSTEKFIFKQPLTNILDIQIGPDRELYMVTLGLEADTFLGRIDNGSVTRLQNTSAMSILELPSYPQSYFVSNFFVKNLCYGDVIEFATDLVENAVTFQWDFGDGNTSNVMVPSHTYLDSGNHTIQLEVSDDNGETYFYSKDITVKDELVSTTLPDEVFICSNEEPIEIDAGLFETFLWSTGETTRKIKVKEPGVYTVFVSNKDCCVGELKTTLIENLAPVIDDISYDELDNYATIYASGSEPLTYILDEEVIQDDNVFRDLSFGTHKMKVIDANGCEISSDFDVRLNIPEYFSPNGDGINDVFKIPQLRGNLDFELQIFDRHRRLIRNFKNQEVLWDGTFSGQQIIADDYWYFLNVNGQIFKGHFSKLN